ncbi:MAG TPA: hypothetical protein VGG96_13060 [Steroidobacteraceae bacterium]|jgi:hypothetical protein
MREEVPDRTSLLAPSFRQPVKGASHAGSDAEDVASRPWGERAPIIEAADACGDQTIEQILLAEIRRLLLVDLLTLQVSDHDDALIALGATLTYRSQPDSDSHRMSQANATAVLHIHAAV